MCKAVNYLHVYFMQGIACVSSASGNGARSWKSWQLRAELAREREPTDAILID